MTSWAARAHDVAHTPTNVVKGAPVNTTLLLPPASTRHVRVSSTEVTEHVWHRGAQRLLADAPWRRVVGVGDSIVAGVGDATPGFPDRSWFDQFADTLAAAGRVDRLNLGVVGARVDQICDEQVGAAVEFAPDLAFVSAGGNDLLGRRFEADAVEERISAIARALTEAGARVVTFSLFNLPSTPFIPDDMRDGLRGRFEQLAALTERVCEAHGGIHVDFFGDPRTGTAELYSADCLHANRRGHALVFSAMVHATAEALR